MALAAVVIATVLGMAAFHAWGAEPMKQWIAERTGQVDRQGQRKRVVMAIGVTISGGEPAARVPWAWPTPGWRRAR